MFTVTNHSRSEIINIIYATRILQNILCTAAILIFSSSGVDFKRRRLSLILINTAVRTALNFENTSSICAQRRWSLMRIDFKRTPIKTNVVNITYQLFTSCSWSVAPPSVIFTHTRRVGILLQKKHLPTQSQDFAPKYYNIIHISTSCASNTDNFSASRSHLCVSFFSMFQSTPEHITIGFRFPIEFCLRLV